MALRMDAVEEAKNLAQNGFTARKIERILKKKGLGGMLDDFEIEQIITGNNVGQSIMRNNRPSRIPKVLGVVAVVAGILGVLGIFGGGMYSIIAILLGVALLLKQD